MKNQDKKTITLSQKQKATVIEFRQQIQMMQAQEEIYIRGILDGAEEYVENTQYVFNEDGNLVPAPEKDTED